MRKFVDRTMFHRNSFDFTGIYVDYLSDVTYSINGREHREDGPAVIIENFKLYYINGKIHREDGPALCNGSKKEYFLHGKKVTKEGHEFYCNLLKLKNIKNA